MMMRQVLEASEVRLDDIKWWKMKVEAKSWCVVLGEKKGDGISNEGLEVEPRLIGVFEHLLQCSLT